MHVHPAIILFKRGVGLETKDAPPTHTFFTVLWKQHNSPSMEIMLQFLNFDFPQDVDVWNDLSWDAGQQKWVQL